MAPSYRKVGPFSRKEHKLTNEELDRIIDKMQFMIDIDYAWFDPEFLRGVSECIRIVNTFKEDDGTSAMSKM